ncbi:hypothetical protein KJ840_01335 [Patescibacteria group bacterium]|nr:hypothetical protein [Patescibacteria group bacterium]
MKILLATHNPAKIKDYRQILEKKGIETLTLNSLEITDKFEENKDSFKENAFDKAKFYYNLSKMPTLAEDGGFEIDYFNGQPGVKSRRWLGYEASDEEIIEFLKTKIKEIPEDKRTCRFTAVCCLVKSPPGADHPLVEELEVRFAKNSIEGYLTDEYNDTYPEGFPYRAFFIEKTFNKYIMDLTSEEYQQINHRQKNIEEIIKFLIDKG